MLEINGKNIKVINFHYWNKCYIVRPTIHITIINEQNWHEKKLGHLDNALLLGYNRNNNVSQVTSTFLWFLKQYTK